MSRLTRLCRTLTLALLLICLNLSMAVPAFAAGAGDFGDVAADAWYYGAVDFVTQRGLFQGTSTGVFSPAGTMTRAMFITVLGRYAGVDPAIWNTGAYHTFSDVSAGSYYAGYATWAYETGVIEGDGSASVFSPDKNVTREQACAILSRFAAVMGLTMGASGDGTSFTDDGSISSWARDSVYALNRAGVVQGRDTGAFDPQGCATRAEAAAIIQRFDAACVAAPQEQPPEQQPEEQPEQPPETADPGENAEVPPVTEGETSFQRHGSPGPLDNDGLVNRLSQDSRYCCLATSFSMAANLLLGRNEYGAFDWTASETNDGLSVPSGTSFNGYDGYIYYPRWGSCLSADELRTAIDSALGSGVPVIASVHGSSTASTHYVVVVGWADAGHSDYLIVDPAGGGDASIRDSAIAMTGGRGYGLGNADGTFVYIDFTWSWPG